MEGQNDNLRDVNKRLGHYTNEKRQQGTWSLIKTHVLIYVTRDEQEKDLKLKGKGGFEQKIKGLNNVYI